MFGWFYRCDHVNGCVPSDLNDRNNTSQDKAKGDLL